MTGYLLLLLASLLTCAGQLCQKQAADRWQVLAPHERRLASTVRWLAGAALLAGALALPFLYETQTLWYKTGADKTMLRAGHLLGMLALFLLIVQVLLAVRARLLEQVFGAATLLRWHRANGVLIALAAAGHVALVQLPEGLGNLPFGWKYWPEMIGGLLFALLVATVISSRYRVGLGLDFIRWRRWHRPAGYLALAFVFIHVRFVSDAFSQGLPRAALIAVFLLLGMVVVWTLAARQRAKRP